MNTNHSNNFYRLKLLREFEQLRSEEAQREVLEYARFIKEEERELERLRLQAKNARPASEVS